LTIVEETTAPSRRSLIARGAALAALIVAFILVVYVLFFAGGGERTYHMLFSNGGQLVTGNQVLVAGQPIGSVDSISLTDNAQAQVDITTDVPLRDGTVAVIRNTSLSGVANRYISITPGPNNAKDLPSGTTIRGENTVAPVDLDQLFNTFNPRTRQGLRDFIKGNAQIYAGAAPQANKTYKYFAPALDSSQRLLAELSSDQRTFTRFIVAGGSVLTAIGQRGNDLTNLVSHAKTTLGSIASQNQALDQTLVKLPPTLRQANTTFVNLRAALDDLDPLVNAAKPATKDLPTFLRNLRPVAERSVPVFTNLATALRKPGPNNDLVSALKGLPRLEQHAATASPHAVAAINASLPTISFARPYGPELAAFVTKIAQATSYYDADGHYVRVSPADTGVFAYNAGTQVLNPIPPSAQYTNLETGVYTRCPGGATQPISGSNPFLDDGSLIGQCDPNDVPPGP
jgi:phospholipid/cholesterol/gamma-HCH transport system substrate-binding protein